jgi:hypothetical protein
MKCPYQDIGCWYIDDVTHNCEAQSKSDCRHETPNDRYDSQRRPETEEDENV